MKLTISLDGAATGAENMRHDLAMLDRCSEDTVNIRFYSWKPYCISLGANQSEDVLHAEHLARYGYECVKRPTGGRAILHAEEVTYAITVQLTRSITPMQIYRETHLALKQGLSRYDARLGAVDFEQHQPDFLAFYKTAPGAACFASTARSELTFDGKKLVGSAQKKIGGKVLQHGSILCGSLHKEIVNFLSAQDEEKAAVMKELEARTITVEDITGKPTDYQELSNALVSGVKDYFIDYGYSVFIT